jgi:hypothetical protein
MRVRRAGRAYSRPEQFAALGAFMESFTKDLAESGELVDTRGLTAPVLAAAARTSNLPQQRYLRARADRLAGAGE